MGDILAASLPPPASNSKPPAAVGAAGAPLSGPQDNSYLFNMNDAHHQQALALPSLPHLPPPPLPPADMQVRVSPCVFFVWACVLSVWVQLECTSDYPAFTNLLVLYVYEEPVQEEVQRVPCRCWVCVVG